MKTYNSAMLSIVSIKNDIITESFGLSSTEYDSNKGAILDGGRRFDDWDAGY